MSLISFHRLLISAGIAFCLLFAGWEVRASLGNGGGSIAVAITFAILGIGLIFYLRRLNHILGYERERG